MRTFWKILIPIIIVCIIAVSCVIFIPVINAGYNKEVEEIPPKMVENPPQIVYGGMLADTVENIKIYSYEYLNNERISANLQPLIQNKTLNYIAKQHSETMAIHNFCGHLDVYGKYPVDRARDMGFNTLKEHNGVLYNGVAENVCAMPHGEIVVGFGKIDVYDFQKIAESMIKCLMDSPEHKENILNEVYTHVGIGVAYGNGYYYLTQDFW